MNDYEVVAWGNEMQSMHRENNKDRRSKFKNLLLFGVSVGLLVSATFLIVGDDFLTTQNSESYFKPPDQLAAVIDDVSKSIVKVKCGNSIGTGWALGTSDGNVIVTNLHVVEECADAFGVVELFPTSDYEGQAIGTIYATDSTSDLAIIRGVPYILGLKTARLPPIGAWLMVIGNPLGLNRSVNFGSVTNIDDEFLITDAAINPGNSGGPVFDSLGRVVGVATSKIVGDGVDRIGIVVPLKKLCEKLIGCPQGKWE